jgi:hypothetical protein
MHLNDNYQELQTVKFVVPRSEKPDLEHPAVEVCDD